MKKYTFKIMFAIAAFFMPMFANAQTYEVYKSNGEKVVYNYNDVDSIVFKAAAKPTPDENCVDLGLTSGIRWATCNLGATACNEAGDYFAYGDLAPKDEYTPDNCPAYLDGSVADIYGYPQYDAAMEILGEGWRMPSYDDMHELEQECTWEWSDVDGVVGYKVIGPNGNSIFLPVTGCMDYSELKYSAFNGLYWSGSSVDAQNSFCLLFDYEMHTCFVSDFRYKGFAIRPVKVD